MKIRSPALLLLLIFSLCACSQATVTTIPAYLELSWSQAIPQTDQKFLPHDIHPELASKLKQISDYQSTTSYTYTTDSALVTHKVRFNKEITFDEFMRITPKLKTIFREQNVNLSFHERQTKQIVQTSLFFFPSTKVEHLSAGVVFNSTLGSNK